MHWGLRSRSPHSMSASASPCPWPIPGHPPTTHSSRMHWSMHHSFGCFDWFPWRMCSQSLPEALFGHQLTRGRGCGWEISHGSPSCTAAHHIWCKQLMYHLLRQSKRSLSLFALPICTDDCIATFNIWHYHLGCHLMKQSQSFLNCKQKTYKKVSTCCNRNVKECVCYTVQ